MCLETFILENEGNDSCSLSDHHIRETERKNDAVCSCIAYIQVGVMVSALDRPRLKFSLQFIQHVSWILKLYSKKEIWHDSFLFCQQIVKRSRSLGDSPILCLLPIIDLLWKGCEEDKQYGNFIFAIFFGKAERKISDYQNNCTLCIDSYTMYTIILNKFH